MSIWGTMWRGLLMGLAEVVPGVSGGTIAFVTGIYPKLVESIARFGVGSLNTIFEWRTFFAYHNLGFLIPLGVGMILGVGLFANLMSWLLSEHQSLVWAFFCGLILMSVLVVAKQQAIQVLVKFAPVGLVAGLSLLLLPTSSSDPSYLMIFLGGAIAVCAWILPAISGSFILLALGLYAPVLSAISGLQIDILAVLAVGCVSGLLLFSKALSWLLARARTQVFSFFTGFMLGSVAKLWPWQSAAGELISPGAAGAQSVDLLMSLVAFAGGAMAMYLIDRLSQLDRDVGS
ncbi:MAG: DUF368 domain-containing protein [Pseudomonadota bacterium]